MRMFLLYVAAFLCLLAQGCADCCKRKGDFGCCGNGPCNIFCCNCDGGCNYECENTSCDTADWIMCAAVVSSCEPLCVAEGNFAACITCLGACKKCFVGAQAKQLDKADYSRLLRDHIKTNGVREEIAEAHAFEKYDLNGDGVIDLHEMEHGGPKSSAWTQTCERSRG